MFDRILEVIKDSSFEFNVGVVFGIWLDWFIVGIFALVDKFILKK